MRQLTSQETSLAAGGDIASIIEGGSHYVGLGWNVTCEYAGMADDLSGNYVSSTLIVCGNSLVVLCTGGNLVEYLNDVWANSTLFT